MTALFLFLSLISLQEPEIDVVFVVDSSNSMLRHDPDGFRTQVAGALQEFLAKRSGARISVIQFAGWNESVSREVVPVLRSTDPKEETP